MFDLLATQKGGLLYPRQDPRPLPRHCSVHQAVGNTRRQREPLSYSSSSPGLGNLVGAGEQSPVLPEGPLPSPLAIPRNGEHGLPRVCCSWGHFSRCGPRAHGRGQGVPHTQAPPTGKGAQSLPEQVDHSLAGDLGNLSGQCPQASSNSPLIYPFKCSWSTLFLDPEHSAAPHCRQDSDFSDCHLLGFPTLPHPSLPTTSLPAQVILRTPVSLVPPFPPRVFPSPKCCSIFVFSPIFLFSCPSQDGARATSSRKPSLTIPPHSDPASPLSSFVVRCHHCLPGDCSCDTLMCEGLSFQLSYKHLESQALALVSAECLRMRAASGLGCSRKKLSSEEILMPRPYLPEILILLFRGVGVGAGRTNYIICRAA